MPELQEFYRRRKSQGLALIAIHTTNGAEKMKAWMQEKGIDVPVCADTGGKTVAAYAVNSYPDYYLIDRSGKLRVADLANGDVERAVDALLAEKAPAPATPAATSAQSVDAAELLAKARTEAKASNRKIFAFPTAKW